MQAAAQIELEATILPPESEIVVYDKFRSQLAELKATNAKTVFPYETKEGNRAARSYVANLRKTKTAISDAHKDAKAASLTYGRKLDAGKNELIGEVDAMITVHQKEIDRIEQLEADRKSAIAQRVADLTIQSGVLFSTPQSSATLKEMLATIKAIAIDDSFAESIADAAKAKDASVALLEKAIAGAEKRETDAAELECLKKESAAKAQSDHEEKIRRDAEDKAKREAEAKATAEREASEKRENDLKEAAVRAEKEKIEAAARAQATADALVKAEADAAAQAEENRKLQERLDAEEVERKKREVEAAAERLAKIAREQAQKEADAKAAADAKRAADEAHQHSIHANIAGALEKLGIGDNQAKAMIEAIRSGEVPHITINY